MSMSFGEFFAALRRERRDMSLREFAATYGFDAGNLSRLERGRLPAPRAREKLEEYARALNIEAGSPEWYEFFDLAAASRGELPADILENADVVDQLPVLFRTLRGGRVSKEDLEKLLDIIKHS